MYLLWKAPRETFKVSQWMPLAFGVKLSVPPPTGLLLCSKQFPELLLHGACFLLWLFFEATWHFSIAATREKRQQNFFPSLSTFQSSCRKASVLSTLSVLPTLNQSIPVLGRKVDLRCSAQKQLLL